MSNISISNDTNPPYNGTVKENDAELPEWELVVTVLLMFLLLVIIVAGNILVILAISKERSLKQHHQNMFLLSLAVADFAIGVTVLPFHIVNHVMGNNWIFGYVVCDIWITSDLMCCTASILHICAIAIDRYLAITKPHKYPRYRTRTNIIVAICVVWVVSFVVSLAPLVGWNDQERSLDTPNDQISCHITTQPGYIIFSSITAFFLPLIIMVCVYLRIWLEAKKRLGGNTSRDRPLANSPEMSKSYGVRKWSLRPLNSSPSPATSDSLNGTNGKNTWKGKNGRSPSRVDETELSNGSEFRQLQEKLKRDRQKANSARERRATVTLGVLMGVFIICWLPYFTNYVIVPFCKSSWCDSPDMRLEAFFVWLGYFNSACNPCIYTYFNHDFRRAFYKLLKCKY